MIQKNTYSIKSSINFDFDTLEMRDISYNTFFPEYNDLKSKRSRTIMKKEGDNSLKFIVESRDITAFRASINEIISFGKILENILSMINS